jgi:type IV secretion system protein VirB5
MSSLTRWIVVPAVVSVFAFSAGPARAGIPVFDASNLAEAIQNVMQSLTQIDNQLTQIQTATMHLNSVNGLRGIANFANNPLLHDYIPTDAGQVLQAIDRSGYAGMSGRGLALRNQNLIYNCTNLQDAAQRTLCQAQLGRPYQHKAFLEDALQSSSRRMTQISALMERSANALDEKATLEANGRLAGETAMLVHENTQAQLVAAQVANEEQIVRSTANQRMLERSTRTGKLSDYFKF